MKKIAIIAVAFMTLSACTKTEIKEYIQKTGSAFEEGQLVTFSISASASTRATSSADGTTGAVSFKWEIGDSIKVSVGPSSNVFHISKLYSGGAKAEFTGKMPAEGDSFDLQFPVIEPVLSQQSYSATEALPHDMMLFKATGCKIDTTSYTLSAVNASLRLNLYGTKTIGKIEVKDESLNTYTLGINPAVALPTAKADSMAFFIVVPAGSYKFSAEVFDNASTPASICKFQTSAARTFVAAEVLDMPAKKVALSTGGAPEEAR